MILKGSRSAQQLNYQLLCLAAYHLLRFSKITYIVFAEWSDQPLSSALLPEVCGTSSQSTLKGTEFLARQVVACIASPHFPDLRITNTATSTQSVVSNNKHSACTACRSGRRKCTQATCMPSYTGKAMQEKATLVSNCHMARRVLRVFCTPLSRSSKLSEPEDESGLRKLLHAEYLSWLTPLSVFTAEREAF